MGHRQKLFLIILQIWDYKWFRDRIFIRGHKTLSQSIKQIHSSHHTSHGRLHTSPLRSPGSELTMGPAWSHLPASSPGYPVCSCSSVFHRLSHLCCSVHKHTLTTPDNLRPHNTFYLNIAKSLSLLWTCQWMDRCNQLTGIIWGVLGEAYPLHTVSLQQTAAPPCDSLMNVL